MFNAFFCRLRKWEQQRTAECYRHYDLNKGFPFYFPMKSLARDCGCDPENDEEMIHFAMDYFCPYRDLPLP